MAGMYSKYNYENLNVPLLRWLTDGFEIFTMFLEDFIISLIKWLPSVIKPKWLFAVNLFILGNLNVKTVLWRTFL